MVRRKNSIEECGDGNKRKRAGLHTQHQPSDHEGVQNFKQFHLSCVMEIHPIHSPLSYIDSYCERILTSSFAQDLSSSLYSSNNFNLGDVYQQLLHENPHYFQDIVPLTTTVARNGLLVRYRCLVQDIKNPEYYVGIGKRSNGYYQVCKYRDYLDDDDDFDELNQIIFERQPIIGIPIPGESSSEWPCPCEEMRYLIHIYDHPPTNHLRLHDMIEVIGIVELNGSKSLKSHGESCDHDDIAIEQPRKKQRNESLESPLPSPRVHFELAPYDEEEEDLLSLISSYQCSKQSNYSSPDPTIFRVHCLFYRPISPTFPFYSSISDPNHLSLIQTLPSPHYLMNHASSIAQSFTSILHDPLVSQYLTLALISSVYNRVESVKSIGNIPINIWNCESVSSDLFQKLLSLIKMIVPRTYVFTLDQEKLETTTFGLSKDDQHNILNSSPLQLGQNTVILIYEKPFSELQTSTTTTSKNIEILRNLILHQKLPIDFNYYHLDLPVNYPVIIFSDQPSFFTSEKLISIKYQPTPAPTIPIMECISPDPIPSQWWWSQCLEINSSISTNPLLIQRIEDDYVKSRQQRDSLRSLTNPDDLHISLALTRLYAASRLEQEINLSHWEYILNLEEERCLR